MTGYDALHPRGQAANAGQFRAKENDAPTGDLTAADAYLERVLNEDDDSRAAEEWAIPADDVRELVKDAYLAGSGLSPKWCGNDEPHEAHTARNEFGGTNSCTGRPATNDEQPQPQPQPALARATEDQLQQVRDECVGWFPDDEPLLYEPTDGQQDGYADVIAVDHGAGRTVKFTIDPDGSLEAYELTTGAAPAAPLTSEDAEKVAADAVIATFVDQRGIADPDIPGEDPAASIGWALGKKVPMEETIRALVIAAQRAARTEA